MDIRARLKNIRMLLLDVDGVLTAGDIVYTDQGEQIKHFHVRDGLGIRMLQKADIQVGIITGRIAGALQHRCANLGIDLIFDGILNKVDALKDIMDRHPEIKPEAIAFMGDDLPDLAILRRVGLAVAVADAHELIREAAHVTTTAPGGRGAVREISEMILKAQDKWDGLIKRLFDA